MGLYKKIAHLAGDAIQKYNMIEDGDKILVGFSGGKDSYALIEILNYLQKRAPINYEIFPVMINPNFKEIDQTKFKKRIEKAKTYFEEKGLNLHVENSNIGEIVMEKADKKICFMCSRLRRGIIYNLAKKHKCNKIALGHNLDDGIQTLMMNIFYSSKNSPLLPKLTSDDGENIVIRPLINVIESDIVEFSKELNFPIIKELCPLKPEESRREYMKNLVDEITSQNKYSYSSAKNALEKQFKFFEKKEK